MLTESQRDACVEINSAVKAATKLFTRVEDFVVEQGGKSRECDFDWPISMSGRYVLPGDIMSIYRRDYA